MNVHPARSLADVYENIRRFAIPVKERVSPDSPFPLGLWFPATSVDELKAQTAEFNAFLSDNGLYAMTMNAFPYGVFHGSAVKQNVYHPDWSTAERLNYTVELIHILAELLPDGMEGSISTVPVTYGKVLPDGAVENLLVVADAARAVHQQSGRRVRIALEPEPDCYLETSAEAIAFFDLLRQADPTAGEYLGVCFDTCHLSLQREDLLEAYIALTDTHGIDISKVQVSAALICDNTDQAAARHHLGDFDEPVYLHQTRIELPSGERLPYADLGPALNDNPAGEWRVHFHVPLPYTGDGALSSTAVELTPEFVAHIFEACPNIEIETYTFDVLPGEKPDIVTSIAGEFDWLNARH
jgi:hypothetical protein